MQNLHVSCVSSQLVSDSGAHGPLGTCPYVRGTAQTCAQAHPRTSERRGGAAGWAHRSGPAKGSWTTSSERSARTGAPG